MNELELISYFENLCIQNKVINHTQDGRESFFYIESGYDLATFDNAIRSCAEGYLMLLVADSGELNDNNSENHTRDIDGEFFILGQISDVLSIAQIRATCLVVLLKFLARMKRDSKARNILPGKPVHFRIDRIPYNKVGPMLGSWYGYQVSFSFICPFGYTVDSATWRDIQDI